MGQVLILHKIRGVTSRVHSSDEIERHGLGPLIYKQSNSCDVHQLQTSTRHLRALYLRHRHAAQVRTRVLSDILAAYQEAGIDVLLLKGAALAHLVYPEPGLRPMRDMDLLVRVSEARRAQGLLADLGFEAPLPPGPDLPGKHLEAATLRTDGLTISVEIHHNLFSDILPTVSMTMAELTGPPLPFEVGQQPAYTLGYEDMLWHLCRHAVHIHQPLRLIWVADIVGFAEQFATAIDWAKMRRRYPFVLTVLAQFHHLTPLSEALRQAAALKIGLPPPDVGLDFQGWPRYSLAQQQAKRRAEIFKDTFFPSPWWLGLNYGLTSRVALAWYRWVGHPLHILGWIRHLRRQN